MVPDQKGLEAQSAEEQENLAGEAWPDGNVCSCEEHGDEKGSCHDDGGREDSCPCRDHDDSEKDHCHCHDEADDDEDHCHCHSEGHAGHFHGHHHLHGASCGCHDEELSEEEEKRARWEIVIGAVLFLGAVAVKLIRGDSYTWPYIVVLALAYLILGWRVLKEAFENLMHGEWMDENFLMSLATLAAFAIQEFPEAVGVMLFFRIGEAFEDLASERSRRRIMEAVDLRPETVTVEKSGGSETVPAGSVRPGTVFLVRPGDRVPLDGTVLEGESYLDTSAVTGEPVPVRVEPGTAVLSGGVNTSGLLRVRADKPLSESMVSRILRSVENAQESKPQIDRFITRFARIYTPCVVGLALLTAFVMPLLRGEAFLPWIYTAISFLVMSCPCALVLSVPLAFFCGIGAASSRGILFKGGASMEQLAGVTAAVMDKTGTITRGTFEVRKVLPAPGIGEEELLRLAAACEEASTHPIAQSIRRAAQEAALDVPAPEAAQEIPGKGIRARVDGREIACGNRALLALGGAGEVPEDTEPGAEVFLAEGRRYLGRLVISDEVKEGAGEAIRRLHDLGIKTVMLTGDGASGAQSVAEEVGIEDWRAHLLPDQKVDELQKIRSAGEKVLFVGDGINDAPVLAGADVGAAMGSGADAAIEAADLVCMNSDPASVPEAVVLSRRVRRTAWQNVIFALAFKAVVMILGVTGIYSNMWLAVFADTGVAVLCILNSVRLLLGTKKNA